MTLQATQCFVIKATGGKISKNWTKTFQLIRESSTLFPSSRFNAHIMQPRSKLLLARDTECPIVNLRLESKTVPPRSGLEKKKFAPWNKHVLKKKAYWKLFIFKAFFYISFKFLSKKNCNFLRRFYST